MPGLVDVGIPHAAKMWWWCGERQRARLLVVVGLAWLLGHEKIDVLLDGAK